MRKLHYYPILYRRAPLDSYSTLLQQQVPAKSVFKHQHQPWNLLREDRDRDHLRGGHQKAVVGFGGKIKAAQATTTAAAMIREETDMETETGIEKENVTEAVTAIMEIDDVITAIAREIVVVVTDTRAAQDRDPLDDTVLDQKTRATR